MSAVVLRRNAFAFALASRRTADFYVRAGKARAACLAGTGVAFAFGGVDQWVWAVLAFAALGVWQGWGLSRAMLHDRTPNNPLLLWAYNSAADGLGRHTVNVPGVIEGVSCIFLTLAIVAGMSDPGAALVAFASVMGFAVSVFSAVFVDSANYNPNDPPFFGFEMLRRWVGPLLTLLAAALVLPWWPGSSLTAPAVVCGLGMLASVRVRETDRIFADACRQAREGERLAGRDEVLNQVHGLSTDLDRALAYGAGLKPQHPEVFEYIQTALVKLQQLTALEEPYTDEAGYPDTLRRAVQRFARSYGAHSHSDIQVARVSEKDHQLARVLVHDLVGNAGKAGASRITLTFAHIDDATVILRVEDDAPPFPTGTWKAPGSSLARLGRTLEARSGSLTLEQSAESKVVSAMWRLKGEGAGS
jgi:hypothetical protein